MSSQKSNTVSPHDNGNAATISIVETSKLLPWLMLVCLMSGFALAASIYANVHYGQAYKELERENRLAQLEIDDFKIALAKAGIYTHDGEKP